MMGKRGEIQERVEVRNKGIEDRKKLRRHTFNRSDVSGL